MPPSVSSLFCSASGQLERIWCMVRWLWPHRTTGVHSQPPSSQIKQSGEGVSTCPQEERHLAC